MRSVPALTQKQVDYEAELVSRSDRTHRPAREEIRGDEVSRVYFIRRSEAAGQRALSSGRRDWQKGPRDPGGNGPGFASAD